MTQDKRNKIPSISLERLDTSDANTIIGNTREEQKAQAFLKILVKIFIFTLKSCSLLINIYFIFQ